MKTVFKALGIILLVLGVMGAVAFLGFSGVEKETSGFVTDSVNAIGDKWDPAELTKRADPGLIKAMTSQGQSVNDLFRIYRKLGKPEAPAECTMKNSTTFKGTSDSYTSASYTCEGRYENGSATISVTVRKGASQSAWQIYYLNIQSPYFTSLLER